MKKLPIIKDLSRDELKQQLIHGFLLVGIRFKEDSQKLVDIAIDTKKYNGNLYVKTLGDLFGWYMLGCLPETEKRYKPEPTAMFITRMRLEFFRDPSKPEELRRKQDAEMEKIQEAIWKEKEEEKARLNKNSGKE
jgi:hypothetical protein